MFTIAALFSAITIIFLNRRNKVSLEATIFIALLAVVSIVSNLLQSLDSVLIRGGGIGDVYADRQMFTNVSEIFGLATLSTFIGASIFSLLFQRRSINEISFTSSLDNEIAEIKRPFEDKEDGLIALFILVSIVGFSYYLWQSFPLLLARSSYIWAIEKNGLVRNLHYYLPLVGVVAFYLLKSVAEKPIHKFMLFLIFIGSIFASFSSGSRVFSFQILVLTIILSISTSSQFLRFVFAILGISLCTFSLSLIVQFRYLPEHGLVPYLTALVNFSEPTNFQLSLVTGTFLLVIPITYLGSQLIPPEGMLWAQVSPLPSNLSGWNFVSDALKLNEFTPSGGVAQIASLGTTTSLLFWLFIGAYLAFSGNIYSRFATIFTEIRLISLALIVGSFLQFIQYSIRLGTRFLYLHLLILIALALYLKIIKSKNKYQP